ncbi:MAG: DHH family phosphoesterase [Nanoarchaeota archaeon]
MDLVIVDHHDINVNLSHPNIETVKAQDLSDFYSKVRSYLVKDYDLVISDEDPDGITSVMVYCLFKGKFVNFKGNRSGLKKNDVQDLESNGIHTILAFDWFPLEFTDLSAFDKIIYLNPQKSGLINVNTSEIVYQSLPETGKKGRDISAVGSICDYLILNCPVKFKEFLLDYNDLFNENYTLLMENKLNQNNVLTFEGKNTKLYDLSLMFWAPFIINGEDGNNDIIKYVIEDKDFNIRNLFTESDSSSANKIKNSYNELLGIIDEEKKSFYNERTLLGDISFYYPKTHRAGFMSKFSSIIADELPEKSLVVIRSLSNDKSTMKYSLRTIYNYGLGKLLVELGVGGGHDKAAGCVIPKDKQEWFEAELVSRISKFNN